MQRPTGSGQHSRRKITVKRGQLILSNVRNRHRVMAAGAILAVLTAVAVSFAVSAKADPAFLAIEGSNGYKTQRVYHPDNDNCWVDLAVDLQRGFNDENVNQHLSGVARISRGPCAVRVQVDAIRPAVGSISITDFYPSKTYAARDNTPGGIPGPCTTFAGGTINLYADVSQEVGCQRGPNRLNSDADYAGNVLTVRGYSDWLYTGTVLNTAPASLTMAVRGFFAIRWSDNSYQQVSLRSFTVPANPNL